MKLKAYVKQLKTIADKSRGSPAFQTVEKVGLPQEKNKTTPQIRKFDLCIFKINGKGIIEKPLPLLAFHQNEPCRTFVLSAFILIKYPFLFQSLPACR